MAVQAMNKAHNMSGRDFIVNILVSPIFYIFPENRDLVNPVTEQFKCQLPLSHMI